MGESSRATVSKARKEHHCFWCGEIIEKNSQYKWWTWFDSNQTPEQIKVHLECNDAWNLASKEEGYPYETGPSEHSRGCACENGWCRCVKARTGSILRTANNSLVGTFVDSK